RPPRGDHGITVTGAWLNNSEIDRIGLAFLIADTFRRLYVQGGFKGWSQHCWQLSVSTVRILAQMAVGRVSRGGRAGRWPGRWFSAAQGLQRLRGQGRPQAVAAGDAQQP